MRDRNAVKDAPVIQPAVSVEAARPSASFILRRAAELSDIVSMLTTENRRVVYIWGPPASGKTMLLGQLAEDLTRLGTLPVVLRVDESSSPDLIRTDLARVLAGVFGLQIQNADWPNLLGAFNRRASQQRLVLCMDGYDSCWSWDGWLRQNVFDRLGGGIALVLTGRRPPNRLWAGNRLWNDALGTLMLKDLDPSALGDFLAQSGISDPRIHEEVYLLSSGRLGFAARAADALNATEAELTQRLLSATGRSSSGRGGGRLVSFLIEHVLHPGSRRGTWRAGSGRDSIDTLVAAACILPIFRRGVLTAMVGRPVVDRYWDYLVELPIVHRYEAGYYALAEPLRSRMESLVTQVRPWASAQWRQKAAQYLVNTVDGDGDFTFEGAWLSLCHFARKRLWRDRLHPLAGNGESWSFDWTSTVDDDDVSGVSLLYAGPMTAVAAFGLRETSAEALRVRDENGRTLGHLDIVSGLDHRGLSVMVVTRIGVDASEPGVERALIRELAKEWGRYESIFWAAGNFSPTEPDRSLAPLLSFLLFERDAEDDAAPWTLNFSALSFREWLRRVTMETDAAPESEDLANMAREALTAIHDPDALARVALADRFLQFNEQASSGHIRTWILDALSSADLGEFPSGRALLTLYYLDRHGSHESLAEHFNVSRATYFRSHRRALALLGEALWHGV